MLSPRALAVLALPVFLLLAIVAGLALRLAQDEKESQYWLDHTYQVILATDHILSDVQAARIAERDYLATRRIEFSRRARASLAAVPADLSRFQSLTADNPRQQMRVAQLRSLLDPWSRFVIAGINSQPPLPDGRSTAPLSLTIADIDQIRSSLHAAANEENRLLAARMSATQELDRSTIMASSLGVLLVLIVLATAVVLLVRSNSRLALSEGERARQARILQATLDSIRDGIAVFETDSTLAAFNPNFFKLGNLPLSLAEAGTPFERFRTFEEGRPQKVFPSESPRGDLGRGTRQIVVGDRNLDVYATPVQNDGVLIAVADVTARVRSEDALRQAQKMEAIGHLTGGVAHDFNNLLQVVSANLDLAEGEVDGNSRLAARLKNAANAVERGSRLTGQLLAFARRQALEPRAMNPGRLVQEMTDMLRRALSERIEVESIIAGGLWNTFADPNQVQNAILNLAINARDAMAGGGKLTIEVANAFLDDDYAAQHAEVTAGQYVMIAVTDTGVGMTQDVMARAFEPFYTTKAEGQGTGLGLSQVYGFVKQSGGHVKIYSEVGEGTTIKIYLPRTKKAQESANLPPDSPMQRGSETILVVEDDDDVRAAVADLLTELGYTVMRAHSAEAALSIMRSGPPVDLLFSDVVMPGPIPTRAMARMAREINPDIKILFTSGYTQNAIVHNGRLDEGVFLLSKPYRKQDLARKLRSLLDEPGAKPAEIARSETAPTHSQKKALIVEDIALVRMTTVEMVREIGLDPVEAGTGREALALLAADETIDILITDLGLPGMSGAELIRESLRQRPSLMIVVVSGYSRESAPEGDIPPHAIFLSKPFDLSQLRRAIVGS